MGLGKQAHRLSDYQFRALLHLVAETSHSERNSVIVQLSFRAGLRAKEIACLRWSMVTDAQGHLADSVALTNDASKGKSGRVIPLHRELVEALGRLYEADGRSRQIGPNDFIINFAKGATDPVIRSNSIQYLFRTWYGKLGFQGATSHSGRRTFITKAARKISEVGGSVRDVQALAGHASMQTTQRYIDTDPEAQRKLIDRL